MVSVMGSVIELAVGQPLFGKILIQKIICRVFFCFLGEKIPDNFQNKAVGQPLFGKTQNSSKFVGLGFPKYVFANV